MKCDMLYKATAGHHAYCQKPQGHKDSCGPATLKEAVAGPVVADIEVPDHTVLSKDSMKRSQRPS